MNPSKHRELPILNYNSSSVSILSMDDDSDSEGGQLWRWSPDAKLVRTASGKVVLVNYANQFSMTLDEQVGKKVSFVSGLTIPFSMPADLPDEVQEELIGYRFFIPAKEFSSYEQLVRDRLTAAFRDSHGLIIMPTEKCNFRCTYCYEDFLRGRMSDENADSLSKAISKMARAAENFALSFFGGEPLLCSDLVIRFSREAFEVMRDRGLPYSAGIATNAYLLTRELFEELLDVGVASYQITLDGSRELHDKQRVTASGQSTFDRIIANINAMSEVDADFWCVIRCNVQKQDYEHILSLFREGALARIRDDKRFLVDVHEIWASDGFEFVHQEEPAGCFSSLSQQMDFYSLNKELESMGFATTTFSANVQGALGNACYAGKPNWFVVGPNLSLYKCTVVFNREENKLGYIGKDGTLVFDKLKNHLWTGSNMLTDKGCSSCHYRIPCGGIACPLTRFTEGSKACPDIKQPANLQSWANALVNSKPCS